MIQTTLIKRIITASILLPIFILAIYQLPQILFQVLLLIIMSLAAYEWTILSKFTHFYQYVSFTALLLSAIIIAVYIISITPALSIIYTVWIALIFWLANIVFVIFYPKLQFFWYKNWQIRAINGVLLLVPTLILLITLHNNSKKLLLLFFSIIWAADIGAYFLGKYCGKHKLIPKVSPNKTIEGIIGGVLSSLLVMFIYTIINNINFNIYHFIFIIILVGFSIIGDLYESLFKRASNSKDSGQLLPGHGGILDRIDSISSAIPIFTVLVLINPICKI